MAATQKKESALDDPEQSDTAPTSGAKQGSAARGRREEDGLRPDLRREAEERRADRRREAG